MFVISINVHCNESKVTSNARFDLNRNVYIHSSKF